MNDQNRRAGQVRGWDPLRDLQGLRTRLVRLVGTRGGSPDVELAETDAGWTVSARLPGVAPEEVALEIDDRELCIRARSEAEVNADNGEPGTGVQTRAFEYRLRLPAEADAERVDAVMDHGLLTITIQRGARTARREIVVGRAPASATRTRSGAPAATDPAADREMHHPDPSSTTMQPPPG